MESIIGGTVGHGVYKSVDYGATWVPANAGIESMSVRALATDPLAGELVYGTTDDGLIRSTNAGQSWSPLTWPELNSDDTPLVIAVDPARPRIVYAASRYTVARSVDAGTSWELLRQHGAPEWWPLAIVADPARSGRILLATQYFGVQRFDVQPDLALEASGPTHVGIGESAHLTFTILNLGPYYATTPRVALQLPAAASNIAVSSKDGNCSVAGAVATCTYDTLRAGFSRDISLQFTPAEGETRVSASVAGDQSDVDTSNNTASVQFQSMALSDLAASITAPATATTGQSFSYAANVTNAGPNTAGDVKVTMQLANGLVVGTVTSSRGTCSTTSATISCMLDALATGDSVTIAITASASSAATYATTISASTQALDEVSGNNSASASTQVSVSTPPPAPSGGSSGGSSGKASSGGGGGSSSLALLLALSLLHLTSRCWSSRDASSGHGADRTRSGV
jgi:uncharacterized repeat protein (TIGR01451 family)